MMPAKTCIQRANKLSHSLIVGLMVICSAPAKRSDDGALDRFPLCHWERGQGERVKGRGAAGGYALAPTLPNGGGSRTIQSGVALRPPQRGCRAGNPALPPHFRTPPSFHGRSSIRMDSAAKEHGNAATGRES